MARFSDGGRAVPDQVQILGRTMSVVEPDLIHGGGQTRRRFAMEMRECVIRKAEPPGDRVKGCLFFCRGAADKPHPAPQGSSYASHLGRRRRRHAHPARHGPMAEAVRVQGRDHEWRRKGPSPGVCRKWNCNENMPQRSPPLLAHRRTFLRRAPIQAELPGNGQQQSPLSSVRQRKSPASSVRPENPESSATIVIEE